MDQPDLEWSTVLRQSLFFCEGVSLILLFLWLKIITWVSNFIESNKGSQCGHISAVSRRKKFWDANLNSLKILLDLNGQKPLCRRAEASPSNLGASAFSQTLPGASAAQSSAASHTTQPTNPDSCCANQLLRADAPQILWGIRKKAAPTPHYNSTGKSGRWRHLTRAGSMWVPGGRISS